MSFLASGARPLWLGLGAALALYACLAGDAYAIRLLTMAGIWALMGIGYQLVFGHIGALSLAQGAFFGCGAYAAALGAQSLGLPLPLGLLLAMLLPAALAALVAIPVLRLETHYLALATLGIAQVVHLVAVNWESVTGGANGLAGVPVPTLLGARLAPGGLAWLVLVWLPVAIAGFALTRLGDGLPGRVLALLREHPPAAASLGIDAARWRFAALVCGAALAGLAGGLAAHTAGVVSPEVADLPVMVTCLTLVVVGGRRHVAGAILGAVLVVHLPEWFRGLDRYWLVAYGVVTLAIVIAAPEGIVGTIDLWWRQRTPREAQNSSAAPIRAPTSGGTATASLVLMVRDLRKRFGGVTALDGVSLSLRRGEIVGVIGPNGSGKTTLVNLVTGLERPDAGTITILGIPVTGWTPHRIARLGLARSFQSVQLPAELTVLDNVAVARTHDLLGNRQGRAIADMLANDIDPALQSARGDAAGVLDDAGLATLADETAGTLPAGTRRLVEVARALTRRPAVLLLDEPAAGLSAAEQTQLQGLLRRAAAAGTAILVVEHTLSFLLPLAARVVCLDRGRIAAEGPPADLQRDPRLAQAYFGLLPPTVEATSP